MYPLRPFLICISLPLFVWSGAADAASFTLRKVVVAGGEAPQGGTFIQFEPVGINRFGAILFDALVKQKGDFRSIYLSRESSLARVAAIGDTTPDGGKLSFIELAYSLEGKSVAFQAGLPMEGRAVASSWLKREP